MREKCRLCLNAISARKGTSIADDKFSTMLSSVFTFPVVHTEHSLPLNVCPKCVTTVHKFYGYSQEVEKNQKLLLQDLEKKAEQEDEESKVVKGEECSTNQEPSLDVSVKKEDETSGDEVNRMMQQEPMPAIIIKQEEGNLSNRVSDRDEQGDVGPVQELVTLMKEQDGSLSSDDDGNAAQLVETLTADDGKSSTVGQKAELHENDRIIQEFFSIRCELCPERDEQRFDRFHSLQLHYRREHQCRGYLRCCGKQLFRRFRVMEHIESHRGTIRCDVCDKPFKSKEYLLRHTAEQHVASGRYFTCTHCSRTFNTEKQLNAHRSTHEPAVCKLCGKSISLQYLKRHMAVMHESARQWYMCDLCGKKFASRPVLERHIQQHRGIEAIEKLDCPYCGKQLNGKYNLRKHVRCMHLEAGGSFRCEVCGHVSPNSVALENHKKRVHSGEKFACDQCGKRFKKKVYLTEHVAALHTRKPLYTCEFCDAVFNSKANYYTHRKTRHREEWEALRAEGKGEPKVKEADGALNG